MSPTEEEEEEIYQQEEELEEINNKGYRNDNRETRTGNCNCSPMDNNWNKSLEKAYSKKENLSSSNAISNSKKKIDSNNANENNITIN